MCLHTLAMVLSLVGLSSPSNTEHTKDRHCEILTGGIDDVDVSVLNLDTLYHIFMTNMNSLYHFYLELQENRGDDSLPTSQALIIGPQAHQLPMPINRSI